MYEAMQLLLDLSRRKWSPQPSTEIFVAIDGPPDQVWQIMTATDGLALPQVVPLVFFNAICDKWLLVMYMAAFITSWLIR